MESWKDGDNVGKFSPYFWKVVWVIGLILIVNFSIDFESQLQKASTKEFDIIPILWFEVLHPILLGFYVALIFAKKWAAKINLSLFWCVTIPSLLLLCSYPLFATLSNFDLLPDRLYNLSIFTWGSNVFISYSYVLGMIAGLTLVLSFFSMQPIKAKR